ncbi:MAG: hypothetical protein ABF513_11910, partial [Acetobacter malorum]
MDVLKGSVKNSFLAATHDGDSFTQHNASKGVWWGMSRAVSRSDCALARAEKKNWGRSLFMSKRQKILNNTRIGCGIAVSPEICMIKCIWNEDCVGALAPETPRSHNKIISVPDAAVLPQTNVASATGKHDQDRSWSCRCAKKS